MKGFKSRPAEAGSPCGRLAPEAHLQILVRLPCGARLAGGPKTPGAFTKGWA